MNRPKLPPDEVFVVAGCKPWNATIFRSVFQNQAGNWHFISEREELTVDNLSSLDPRYVFFLHWSWKVSEDITSRWECICFHMTDLPFGRGGSPLQNLVSRGFDDTVLTAFRMTNGIDDGPVYAKQPLALHGNAEEILIRASEQAAEMIRAIVVNRPKPVAQEGDPVFFRRRTPDESALPEGLSDVKELYDFIRMLDGAGYPRAFLRFGRFQLELSRVSLYDGRIVADATISLVPDTTT